VFHVFFIVAIGYWQLAMGRLLYALRFYSGFISFFDFIRFMLLGSPPFSGGSAVMLVVLFSSFFSSAEGIPGP
jgi:hypothetical protein